MQIKNLFFFFILMVIASCSEDTDISVPRNLQEYIDANSNKEKANVIACAASASGNSRLTYIFYYPIEGAIDVRYYEADTTSVEGTDFANYRRIILSEEAVSGGKLNRFSRSNSDEGWCVVTYLKGGAFHASEPIKMQNSSKTTQYKTDVIIESTENLSPIFTWTDGTIDENIIYFQIITDAENEEGEEEFISGTYTEEKYFQFYDTSNVVLDINEDVIPQLVVANEYNFTLMGVSEDNWVNLIIQQTFTTE